MRTYILILCALVFQIAESFDFKRTDLLHKKPRNADRNGGTLIPETTLPPYDRTVLDEDDEYVTTDGVTFTKTDSDPWKAFDKMLRSSSDNPNLREGDIYASPDDRQAVNEGTCHERWPGIVRYAFHSSFNVANEAAVQQAVTMWDDSTCLTFVDITSDPTAQANERHIRIRSDNSGCWSLVGMNCSNGQDLNLESPGCIYQSVIIHEIGHALGLYHEHSRTDRDTYVTINFNNVNPNKTHNFNLATDSQNLGTRYDYDSTMHYGRTAFTIDSSKVTIETENPLHQFRIGEQSSFSHKDKAIVNLMYECGSGCSGDCLNGGYFDENCNCICPPNYNGTTCDNKFKEPYDPMYDSCGPQLIETDATIQTFNWPNAHPDETKCMWHLKPPKNKRAKITFDAFDLHDDPAIDYVWILLDAYNGETKFKGTELLGQSKISVDDSGMVVIWRTGYLNASTGFQATVTMVDGPSPPLPPPPPPPSPPPAPKPKKCKKGKKGKKCRKMLKKCKKDKFKNTKKCKKFIKKYTGF